MVKTVFGVLMLKFKKKKKLDLNANLRSFKGCSYVRFQMDFQLHSSSVRFQMEFQLHSSYVRFQINSSYLRWNYASTFFSWYLLIFSTVNYTPNVFNLSGHHPPLSLRDSLAPHATNASLPLSTRSCRRKWTEAECAIHCTSLSPWRYAQYLCKSSETFTY